MCEAFREEEAFDEEVFPLDCLIPDEKDDWKGMFTRKQRRIKGKEQKRSENEIRDKIKLVFGEFLSNGGKGNGARSKKRKKLFAIHPELVQVDGIYKVPCENCYIFWSFEQVCLNNTISKNSIEKGVEGREAQSNLHLCCYPCKDRMEKLKLTLEQHRKWLLSEEGVLWLESRNEP